MERPPDWAMEWAEVIGPFITLVLAIVAAMSARAAWSSARTAKKVFQAAPRSFPYIAWEGVRLTKGATDGEEEGWEKAGLILKAQVHEAARVPTTLHEVRLQLRVGAKELAYERGQKPQIRKVEIKDEVTLFGEHVYYALEKVAEVRINRGEYDEFAAKGMDFVRIEWELVVSVPQQERETWTTDTVLRDTGEENGQRTFAIRQYPPSRELEQE